MTFKGGSIELPLFEASQPWRLFLMTGILGGYTTFSAFSLDTALLYERGEIRLAAFYVLGSSRFRFSACSRDWRWCAVLPDGVATAHGHP
jgi:fluoride ion exporter CrcB/FEX